MNNQHSLRAAAGGAFALASLLAVGGPAGATQDGSATVGNDTLVVLGTSGADSVALRLAPGEADTMQVDVGAGTVRSFDRSTFSRIQVFLGSGNDVFRVDQANGTFVDEGITVDAGSGNDIIDGGDGSELFLGGSGRDSVDGNKGADTAVLGSGSDVFTWDPGDGSDAVDGGAGTDTMAFNGSGQDEVMSLGPNGEDAVFLRNVGNVRMDLADIEVVDVVARDGVDAITVGDLSGTEVRLAEVDLSVGAAPDTFADRVVVEGTPRSDRIDVELDGAAVEIEGLPAATRITGGDLRDVLQVNAGDGDDRVDVDGDVIAAVGVGIDVGPGQR